MQKLKKSPLVFLTQACSRSIGTSIISPSQTELMDIFNISSTEAILPVTLYTIALGFGPIVGGPLSETVGRLPVYAGALILGALFTLGAGFAKQFSTLCVLRFLAGFCWAPVLAVAPGSLAETFEPRVRGFVFAICILMPSWGPGLGYISIKLQVSSSKSKLITAV
jgi:MFS family permease